MRKIIDVTGAHVLTDVVVRVAVVLAQIEGVGGVDAVTGEWAETAVGNLVERVAPLVVEGQREVFRPVLLREHDAVEIPIGGARYLGDIAEVRIGSGVGEFGKAR